LQVYVHAEDIDAQVTQLSHLCSLQEYFQLHTMPISTPSNTTKKFDKIHIPIHHCPMTVHDLANPTAVICHCLLKSITVKISHNIHFTHSTEKYNNTIHMEPRQETSKSRIALIETFICRHLTTTINTCNHMYGCILSYPTDHTGIQWYLKILPA